ncbi:MAG: redoxin domain-containing protein [Planctomycetes bacterium]|nr:redoxin domain-containing protein [Planctomycetota bacterium]
MKLHVVTFVLASFGAPVGLAPREQTPPAPEAKKEPKKEEKLAPAEVGKPAPDFTLTDVDGKLVKLSDFKGKIVVLEWFNQDCPYCQYAYGDAGPLKELPERMTKRGIVWLSINSGTSANADAAKKFLAARKSNARVLLDADGKVGTAYAAKTTPHCYVVDEKGVLRYRGALDNAPMGQVADRESKTNHVEAAVNALENGKAVTRQETKPYGCPVKYAKP